MREIVGLQCEPESAFDCLLDGKQQRDGGQRDFARRRDLADAGGSCQPNDCGDAKTRGGGKTHVVLRCSVPAGWSSPGLERGNRVLVSAKAALSLAMRVRVSNSESKSLSL